MYVRKDRSTITSVVVGAVCDNCGEELRPVHARGDGTWVTPHAMGALDIVLEGGYNQYFDTTLLSFVFCRSCADKLVDAFPCINRAIEDATKMQIMHDEFREFGE